MIAEQPVLTIPQVTLTLSYGIPSPTVSPAGESQGERGAPSEVNAPASPPGAFKVQPGQIPLGTLHTPVPILTPVIILTPSPVTEPTGSVEENTYLIPSLPAPPAVQTPEPLKIETPALTVSSTPVSPYRTPGLTPVPAVTYFPNPQSGGEIHADFSATPAKGTPPLTVQFTDLSTGPVAGFIWEFGDGTQVTDGNPAHTYAVKGTYSVRLTVKSSTGSSTALKDQYIIVSDQVDANFTFEQLKKTYPYRVQFSDTSRGDPVTFEWDFGDGVLSTDKSPTHTYVRTGTYTVVLIVSNPLGRDSVQQTVNVVAEQPPVVIPTAPQVTVTEQKLVLVPGWNLIAIPYGTRSGSSLAVALDKVDTDSHSLWRVNRTSKAYERIMPDSLLEPLEAVWVYSRSETTVSTGHEDLTRVEAISLKTGWNAVGYPLYVPRPAREALSSIDGKWSHIIGYDTRLQAYETAIIRGGSGEFSDTRELEPGRGYLVFTTEDGLLTLF